ncbi:glycogen branching protein [Pseudomonas stutzeri]|uniref:Glycogen branching protein n=1 Tax=Stutzerimonas stutzeri TaxID=316 RepID=A0A2N8RZ66_STUST|nr:glycogen branching protein [Stutzerimonas stutzeri]MCQ4297499.1 glycogen branching protein [Stutzerimonas stutzeri]PNF79636.1 glycogen branching protein [Stutzerimonas stutzeri]
MPRVTISKPFNYQQGGDVKRYEVGAQDVTQAVADHAKAKGFLKPEPQPEAQSNSAPKGETKK